MVAREDEAIIWAKCYTNRAGDVQYIGYGIREERMLFANTPNWHYVALYDIHGNFKPFFMSMMSEDFEPTKEEVLAWQLAKMKS